MGVSVCIPTSTRQVPAGVFSVFSIPDGGTHRADQRHHQQDAKQNQDLHVGHPFHVWALQRRLGGILERRLVNTFGSGGHSLRREIVVFVDSIINFTCISLESWPV